MGKSLTEGLLFSPKKIPGTEEVGSPNLEAVAVA